MTKRMFWCGFVAAAAFLACIRATAGQPSETSTQATRAATLRPAAAAPGADSTARGLIETALAAFGGTTNFAAAVDVNSVDRQQGQPVVTRAKETWHFSRADGTDRLIRTRYLPFPGKEVFESEGFAGGRMVAQKAAPLPADFSLPGFEACNLLAEMLAAGPVAESREPGTVIVSTVSPSGGTLKAWFAAKAVLPRRIERRQGEMLISTFTRAAAGKHDHVLPLQDALYSYDRGQLTATVSRSFSNVQESPVSSREKTSLK